MATVYQILSQIPPLKSNDKDNQIRPGTIRFHYPFNFGLNLIIKKIQCFIIKKRGTVKINKLKTNEILKQSKKHCIYESCSTLLKTFRSLLWFLKLWKENNFTSSISIIQRDCDVLPAQRVSPATLSVAVPTHHFLNSRPASLPSKYCCRTQYLSSQS